MTTKGRWLGLLAGLLAGFSRRPANPAPPVRDFRTGTQRIGLRFTDRIRTLYRSRWIRPGRRD